MPTNQIDKRTLSVMPLCRGHITAASLHAWYRRAPMNPGARLIRRSSSCDVCFEHILAVYLSAILQERSQSGPGLYTTNVRAYAPNPKRGSSDPRFAPLARHSSITFQLTTGPPLHAPSRCRIDLHFPKQAIYICLHRTSRLHFSCSSPHLASPRQLASLRRSAVASLHPCISALMHDRQGALRLKSR